MTVSPVEALAFLLCSAPTCRTSWLEGLTISTRNVHSSPAGSRKERSEWPRGPAPKTDRCSWPQYERPIWFPQVDPCNLAGSYARRAPGSKIARAVRSGGTSKAGASPPALLSTSTSPDASPVPSTCPAWLVALNGLRVSEGCAADVERVHPARRRRHQYARAGTTTHPSKRGGRT